MEIKLLSCPLCSNPHFDGVGSLRSTLVNVATKLVSCPVCSETLLGLDKLTIHLFSHVSNAVATKTVSEHDIQEEIDKSIENVSKSEVDPGQKSTPLLKSIKCDICNFSFNDRNVLEMHQKLLHHTPPDKKTGTYNYHCHLCSKQFRMRGSLMVHLRVAHYGYGRGDDTGCDSTKEDGARVDEVVNDKKVVDDGKILQKNSTSKVIDNKHWECDVCSKMFTTKYFLKKHKRLHTGEMPYCCSLCNKSFTFQQSYHKHMLYHSSEKPHVCNECGRAFKELSTLQNHARIHSGERPFVCETCGKSFRQRVSYLVHRRIHTGVMPYKCTACNKCFRYKVSQKSHKCFMNPPGSVVLIPEQKSGPNSPENSSKSVMNVDLNTGNISVIPQKVQTNADSKPTAEDSLVQKESIVINNNERIEISYKKADLQTAIQREILFQKDGITSGIISQEKNAMQENQDKLREVMLIPPGDDLFSVTLSNILPEVESLYLHGSPINNSNGAEQFLEREEAVNITDMREQCLEEFLCDI
ncbi:unnamed protein product [Phaedon cochleariae]|uniref:C2H2-type domain-containing protein n=1 Tax=Phaedon cochleariae TaxID=80249 RepID=A0A9P0DWL3_PHACE|nr:unnamed protein product [Phaedon cochleariae]